MRAHARRVANEEGLEAALDLVFELLASARTSNDALTARLHTVLRKLYGRSSEKVSNNQLVLAFSELQAAVPEVLDVQDTNASENDSSKGTNAHGNSPHPSPNPKSGSQHKGHGR